MCDNEEFLRKQRGIAGVHQDNVVEISNTENSYVGDSPAPIVKSVKFTCAHVNFTLNNISNIVLDRRNCSRGYKMHWWSLIMSLLCSSKKSVLDICFQEQHNIIKQNSFNLQLATDLKLEKISWLKTGQIALV